MTYIQMKTANSQSFYWRIKGEKTFLKPSGYYSKKF